MSGTPFDGLGITGPERLARIEAEQRATNLQLAALRDSLNDATVEMKGSHIDLKDHDRRIRALELKFYGILAGMVGGVVYLVLNRGSL